MKNPLEILDNGVEGDSNNQKLDLLKQVNFNMLL